jgi:hypothetical protein
MPFRRDRFGKQMQFSEKCNNLQKIWQNNVQRYIFKLYEIFVKPVINFLN